jgi:hypothetical protein
LTMKAQCRDLDRNPNGVKESCLVVADYIRKTDTTKLDEYK